mmetsp:Transcript_15417/g.37973  ORF Transcript_15417/g.37973 Transcript_15417/m.37973 type:complete len:111 (-) Transcript_15417:117-449(-)
MHAQFHCRCNCIEYLKGSMPFYHARLSTAAKKELERTSSSQRLCVSKSTHTVGPSCIQFWQWHTCFRLSVSEVASRSFRRDICPVSIDLVVVMRQDLKPFLNEKISTRGT